MTNTRTSLAQDNIHFKVIKTEVKQKQFLPLPARTMKLSTQGQSAYWTKQDKNLLQEPLAFAKQMQPDSQENQFLGHLQQDPKEALLFLSEISRKQIVE